MTGYNSNLQIREYESSDRAALLDTLIEFQNYLAETDKKKDCRPFHDDSEVEKYLDQTLKDAKEREGKVFIALIDNEIAGFIQFIIDRHKDDILYNTTHGAGAHGWIGELYTKPEFRGQGIGKKLIEEAESYFKSNGCINSRIFVMSDNKLALSVYKKLGYDERDVELSKDL